MDEIHVPTKTQIKAARLKQRIATLPYHQYSQFRQTVIKAADISTNTYWRVLDGRSNNFAVIYIIAQLFACDIDQLIDPDYELSLPAD